MNLAPRVSTQIVGATSVVDRVITGVPGPVAYLLIFLLPALESSIFLGFVIPGETAVVLGGVLAYHHEISLAGAIACGITGAIIGDSIGYEVGRHFGERARATRLGQVVGDKRWATADEFLHARKGPAIFFGRFTALLRALVPAAAGMAKIHYRSFVFWNAFGGVVWATAFTLLGYFAGSAYHRVEQVSSRFSLALLVVVAVALFIHHRRKRNTTGE